MTKQYAVNQQTQDYWETATPEQLQTLEFNIDNQLLFETLLFEIRGTTIKYTSWLKKTRMEAKKLILHNLEKAEIDSDNSPDDLNLRETLRNCRVAADEIEKREAEGAAVR